MYIDPHLLPISGIIYDGRTAGRRFLLNLPFQVSYSLPSQLLSLVLRCVCTPNPFFLFSFVEDIIYCLFHRDHLEETGKFSHLLNLYFPSSYCDIGFLYLFGFLGLHEQF